MEWLRFIWVLEHTAAVGRREGGGTHPQGSPVLGSDPRREERNWATVQPLCSVLPKGRLDPPAQTGSVPRKHHSAPRFVKFTSRRVCGPSVLLKQSKGVKAEQGRGCELVFPRFPQNLISSPKQLECLVFSKDGKKNLFTALLTSLTIQGWPILQQKAVSCFLHYWLSILLMFANDLRSLLRRQSSRN